MKPLVIDRVTGKTFSEKVFGEKWLEMLYGDDFLSRFFGTPLLHTLIKQPFFSKLYGWWQKQPFTRKKIQPFIETYGIDADEFEKDVDAFASFNDFFIRKLKKAARPVCPEEACIPADGRYLFYPNVEKADGFVIKGKKFSLSSLFQDKNIADKYAKGSLVIARLAPCDYHRFHFPCSGIPSKPKLIRGPLFSVNPLALKRNLSILTENKRVITELASPLFGSVAIIEVGATNVGSIVQTYCPKQKVKKGQEKGYFSFGGSTLLLLFEENKLVFREELIKASANHLEVRCLMGQPLGIANT